MADATERLIVNSDNASIDKNYKNFTLEEEESWYDDDDINGGAAIFVASGTLSTSGTTGYTFSKNSSEATYGGGAIQLYEANIIADKLTFTQNSATNNGGAINIKDSTKKLASTISNSTFTGNTAALGGAIFMDGYGTLTIDGCKFTTATDTIHLGNANQTLIFTNNIELAASITAGSNNTKTTLNNANLKFTNNAAIRLLTLKVTGTDNSMTFKTFNGSNTVAFTNQDLSSVALSYTHSAIDSETGVDTDLIATGVTKINSGLLLPEYSNSNKTISFFSLDSGNLTHNVADTLTVTNGGAANAPGMFSSFDALYDFAADFQGTIKSEVQAGRKLIGAMYGTTRNTDRVQLNIEGEVTGSAYSVLANDAELVGFSKTTIEVNGTVGKYVIGGAYASNGGKANVGEAEVVLAGTLKNNVFGGSWVSGDEDNASSSECASVKVMIEEGANQTKGYVLGGGMASGKNMTSLVTNSNITVNADFDSEIFAGGWAQKEGMAEVKNAKVEILDGTVYKVYAGGTNQAGSISDVTEEAVITLDGGTAEFIYLNGRYFGSKVSADVTLEVKQNAVVGTIEGLTATQTVASAETNTSINVAAVLTVDEISHVDNWNIQEGGAIEFTDFLDFDQKIQRKTAFGQINLNINDATVDADGRDVLTALGGIENFNSDFVSVTLNDQVANYDAVAKAFVSDSYSLSIVDDSRLVFANTAQLV